MIKASTHIATMAQKPLATAAVNCKVDRYSRFSEHQTWHLMNGKKFVVCCKLALLLFELSAQPQEIDLFYVNNYMTLTANTKVTH